MLPSITVKPYFRLALNSCGFLVQIEQLALLKQQAAVRDLRWDPLASWLAVSLVSSQVHLWRPNLAGEWKLIQQLVGSSEEQMNE